MVDFYLYATKESYQWLTIPYSDSIKFKAAAEIKNLYTYRISVSYIIKPNILLDVLVTAYDIKGYSETVTPLGPSSIPDMFDFEYDTFYTTIPAYSRDIFCYITFVSV